MNEHIPTNIGDKPHVCEVCNKGFSKKQNLNNHLLTHTGKKPHICEVCNKGFLKRERA